jgi:hypothetical protein
LRPKVLIIVILAPCLDRASSKAMDEYQVHKRFRGGVEKREPVRAEDVA